MSDVKRESYQNKLSSKNKIGRLFWWWVYTFLFRPSGMPCMFCYRWRNMLLRLFGAKIAQTAVVHATARIWAPWNLEMNDYACIDDRVNVYCVDKIKIGVHATVSFDSLLCTASHNIYSHDHELTTAPIIIGNYAWVGASSYIGMGVSIGDGAVVAASSSVHKDVESWSIVGGNPAKFVKKRAFVEG